MIDESIFLSVVIPVYNAEKYLQDCLKSVLKFPGHSMEVLLVNDGSTDRSEEICKKWAEQDKRVKIINKNNGGVSSARNAGINSAKGLYILFMDADDMLADNWWEILYPYMDGTTEFAAFSYMSLYADGKLSEEPFPGEKIITDKKEFDYILLASPLLHTCWAKLFLNRIIKDNKVYFPENLKIGEDYYFVLKYMQYAENNRLINTPILYYRQTPTGAMRNFNYEVRIRDMKILRDYVYDYVGESVNADLKSKMSVYYFKALTKLMRDIAQATKDFGKCRKIYKRLMNEKLYNDIMNECVFAELPVHKKVEHFMMKKKMKLFLVWYFEFKSSLAK